MNWLSMTLVQCSINWLCMTLVQCVSLFFVRYSMNWLSMTLVQCVSLFFVRYSMNWLSMTLVQSVRVCGEMSLKIGRDANVVWCGLCSLVGKIRPKYLKYANCFIFLEELKQELSQYFVVVALVVVFDASHYFIFFSSYYYRCRNLFFSYIHCIVYNYFV